MCLSKSYPSMPGICTSVRIRSGESFVNSLTTASPEEKVLTSKPDEDRLSSRTTLIALSSSATQTLCTFNILIF